MKIVSLMKPAVMIAAMMAVNAFAGDVPKLVSFTVEDVSTPNKPLVDFVATYQGEIEDIRKLSLNFDVRTNRGTQQLDASGTYISSEHGGGTNWVVRYRWEAYNAMSELTNYDIRVQFAGEYPYGGVQLWDNGPYWMETNVGANKPAEYGYYFQWGDTIGYKRENGKWVASDGSSDDWSFNLESWLTDDKTFGELMEMGILEEPESGKFRLTAPYDAAQVHLGGPWRMPLDGEVIDIADNTDAKWTELDQVKGFEMRGKGPYAERALFFPAAGVGQLKNQESVNIVAGIWSTTPDGFSGQGMIYAVMLRWYESPDFPWASGLQAGGHDFRNRAMPVRAMRSWDSGRVSTEEMRFTIDSRFTDTPIRVPYRWLLANYSDLRDADDEAFEARAKETAANGVNTVWECFLAGFDPNDKDARLALKMERSDDGGFWVTWEPSLEERYYEVHGRSSLDVGEWERVAQPWHKFFRVKVTDVWGPEFNQHRFRLDPEERPSVVLWEGGPAWATFNIGATAPHEYGYSFQYGDPYGSKWVTDDEETGAGHWQRMNREGKNFVFDEDSCPTFGKSQDELRASGMIDENGNLTAKYDAARVHWGKEWRMPTKEDFEALFANCPGIYFGQKGGVDGLYFRGAGKYREALLFLPIAGAAAGSDAPSYQFGVYRIATNNGDSHAGRSSYALKMSASMERYEIVENVGRAAGLSIRPIRVTPPEP